jgi:hypothetical protein
MAAEFSKRVKAGALPVDGFKEFYLIAGEGCPEGVTGL